MHKNSCKILYSHNGTSLIIAKKLQLGALTDNMTLLDRCVILADNMEVALERANMLHNRTYQETDFDMVCHFMHIFVACFFD